MGSEMCIRDRKEAVKVLTDYCGVKPDGMCIAWGFGYSCMFTAQDIAPEHMPETLKKGVRVTRDGLLTVDRRTKVGREFLREWDTLDCAKGLSGKSLEKFGIYTLDPDTRKYGFWRVYMTGDDLYCLAVGEYAARRLTDEAKSMMTIDL